VTFTVEFDDDDVEKTHANVYVPVPPVADATNVHVVGSTAVALHGRF
jgi:hypothetical protein